MSIPKQVEENAQMAEELLAGMHKDAETEEEAAAEESDDNVEEEAADESETSDGDELSEEELSYKARYESLQGKYNAEVPKLHNDIRELKESVFERLGNLETPAEDPEETATAAQEEEDLLADYREDYDEDLLNMVDKVATARAEKLFSQSLAPVQDKINNVETTQSRAAQEEFVADLERNLPDGLDWQALWSGSDPAFVEFLNRPDPSGFYTYGDLARLSNDNWNAEKLANVFKVYLTETGQLVEERQEEEVPERVNPADAARVSPDTRKPVDSEPTSGDPKIWTQEAIREFKEKDRKGKYDDEMSKQLWDDLLRAPAENRVRFN